jgi:hypothetical protein
VWQELRTELHPKGLEVVTVALDTGGAEAARPFIEAAAPEHPSLIDVAHVTDELFGFVNVPNAVWIDESGVLVRPPEPAFPGRSPIMEQFEQLDLSTLSPEIADALTQVRKIRSDPVAYRAALEDWVEHGASSRHALAPAEVVLRSGPRPMPAAVAAAHFELGQHLYRAGHVDDAAGHFREAHRLQPDNWTYKRQAWSFADPHQGPTPLYDGYWLKDVKEIGAENYYPVPDL